MSSRLTEARRVLKETFGYDDFRPGQWDIVSAVLDGRDTVGVLPTGGGKSLCYQVPALMFPACTLVVSPLVALMTDQVGRLKSLGVAAEALHSGLSSGQVNDIMFNAHAGRLKLLYVAPERLESSAFRGQMATVSLSLLAVDEAHCISEWGHDFRPAYRNIMRLFETRNRVPIAAFTATATPDVREDIAKSLQLQNRVEIVRGFDRPNLAFRVETTPHKVEWISQHAKHHAGECTIVYAGSRRRVDSIREELSKRGVQAQAYHAGKPQSVRAEIQHAFTTNNVDVLVATNAFGMGIDKADVRHVVHADLTLTLEAYYQEAGRAGRDGAPSTCTLLYQPEDRRLMDFFIASAFPERKLVTMVVDHLYDRARVAEGHTTSDVVKADADSLAVDLHIPSAHANGVLALLERNGVIVRLSASGRSQLRLRSSMERFREFYANVKHELKAALAALERAIPTDSERILSFNVTSFLRSNGLTATEFGAAIRSLVAAHIVQYSPPEGGGGIALLLPRPRSLSELPLDLDNVAQRRNHARSKLDVVIRYAETPQCKRNAILGYFGDEIHGTCGRCSSCTNKQQAQIRTSPDLLADIVRAAHELSGRFGKHVLADVLTGTVSERCMEYGLMKAVMWGRASAYSRESVLNSIDAAIRSGHVIVSTGQYPTIAASGEGARVASPLPKPMRLVKRADTKHVDDDVVKGLVVWRDGIARGREESPTSLLTLKNIERLAMDKPVVVSELKAGEHGSGLFLAEYGQQIVDVVRRTVSMPSVTTHDLDEETAKVVAAVTGRRNIVDVARVVRMTPAATAQRLQRALEAGVDIDRGELVPDELFGKVMDFLRENRFAKLRHVREQVDEVDLPTLRVAIAFARRELFGV